MGAFSVNGQTCHGEQDTGTFVFPTASYHSLIEAGLSSSTSSVEKRCRKPMKRRRTNIHSSVFGSVVAPEGQMGEVNITPLSRTDEGMYSARCGSSGAVRKR